MADNGKNREYGSTVQSGSGRKFRYKTLAEDFCQLDSFFLEFAASYNIATGYKRKVSSVVSEFVEYLDLPFVIRATNYITPFVAKAANCTEGAPYPLPVLEYYWKSGCVNPLSFAHIIALRTLSADDLKALNKTVSKANAVIKSFFERRDKVFVSADFAFGVFEGKYLLVGDFTPVSLGIVARTGELPVFRPQSNAAELKNYTEMLLECIRS